MTEKYIFIDFDGYKSISDLRKSIGERVFELKNHGFDDNQILKIVFEDNHYFQQLMGTIEKRIH